ncbi:hypothetical protein D3C79_574300 [compost metagenome]
MFQHPGQHAAGRGLAVGTGNGQHPAALQHVVGQPLRAGNIGQALVQHVFHRRVATRHGVADDHQVWRRVQLGRVIALGQLDALGFELGAHRGIDVGVRAGDAVAKFLGQHRQRAHESAANTENVNMHGRPRKTSRQGSPGRDKSHQMFRSVGPGDAVFAQFSIQGIAADAQVLGDTGEVPVFCLQGRQQRMALGIL